MKLLDSLRDNKESIAAVAIGVIAAGSTALFGLYVAKRKQKFIRRATVKCSCGKVTVDITQPAANYKYMEPTNMQCACNDCMGYCKAVRQEKESDHFFQKYFSNNLL